MREAPPELRYHIERGIPIPKSKQEIAKVMNKLEVGDSFLIPQGTAKSQFYPTAYLLAIKIKIRGRRVWRVK